MHELVRDYYGKQVQRTRDLKTQSCCNVGQIPQWLKPLLAHIHPSVMERYYGCGLTCPPLLDGCRVLDLGCGAGRDVYLLAQLVGPQGEVIGVDMTEEQLAVAESYRSWHAQRFGFANVRFLKGYIENLEALDLEPASFDVIVSNCVVNLSPEKAAVLTGVKRLLKQGGEFYFSDIYADRRVPESLRTNPVIYGECLGGALYWNDFLRMARAAGFPDPRLVEDRPLTITEPQLAACLGNVRFFATTYRLFHVPDLEDDHEDYGQAVIYLGTIPNYPHQLVLDKLYQMPTGKVVPVCGNTWRILQASQLAPHFTFIGDFQHHYGIVRGCGKDLPFTDQSTGENHYASCC
jgi:arsenite methyltransferase